MKKTSTQKSSTTKSKPVSKPDPQLGPSLPTKKDTQKTIEAPVVQEQHKLPTGNAWSTLAPVLAPETLDVITNDFGFTHLTAVQSATIPAFLSNKDVCVQAVTGSGKTLAFVVPMIEILTTLRSPLEKHHVGAIIITPTRELAQQIHSIVTQFAAKVPLDCDNTRFLTPPGLCIGGKNPEQELHALKTNGANILIGTPGRLDQVLNTKFLFDSSKVELLILDEADRLLEAGFQVNLTSIMKRIPKQRRTGLFSATLTTQIQELAKVGLRNPVDITLKVRYKDEAKNKSDENVKNGEMGNGGGDDDDGQSDDDSVPQQSQLQTGQRHQAIPTTLTNYYQIVQPEHKLLHLVQFLLQHAHENIIIFFLTCAEVDYFYRILASFPPLATLFNSFNNEMIDTVGLQHLASTQNKDRALFCALHGQMNQSKRSRTLEAFKTHTTKYNAENYKNNSTGEKRLGSVLLCTDVAARGVDVNHIDWVLQIDPPQQPDVFIHRIGRCARAGQRGQALTWLLPTEDSFIQMMLTKFVPFQDYTPIQSAQFDKLMKKSIDAGENTLSVLQPNAKKDKDSDVAVLSKNYNLKDIELIWDKSCWSPCTELYHQTEKQSDEETNTAVNNDDENDENDENERLGKKQKNNNNNTKGGEKLVSLSNPSSGLGKQLNLTPLPSIESFKDVIPYNVYKVLVEKKESRREFKNETKKQGQVEHFAFKKQQDIQKEQVERQAQLPPYTTVSIKYPNIPNVTPKMLQNPVFLANYIIPSFIPHCRYAVSYDRYLFELCQKAYVSHINGYKEHMAKFIFPFDRLLFVHVAIGFGMLFLPQLADLKKYALIWPQLTRLQPKMITQFHNQQISEIKAVENEKKKEASQRAIAKRQENERQKLKEREFNQKQREKKNKTRAKTTYEEVRKEWEELGDELRDLKKRKKLSKKMQ